VRTLPGWKISHFGSLVRNGRDTGVPGVVSGLQAIKG
jgi:hypothetical protein